MESSNKQKYYMTIDQGTSSTKVCVFNEDGNLISKKSLEHKQIIYNEIFVEHDPNEILQNCQSLIESTVSQFKSTSIGQVKDIISLSITNQRETLVAWDRQTGKSLYNAIVWYDKRTEQICQNHIKNLRSKNYFTKINGLPISTYFSAFKLQWLIENIEAINKAHLEDRLMIGTIDSWLVYNLSKEKNHYTDRSNASRTFLYNLAEGKWDDQIVEYFGFKTNIFPSIKLNADNYGTLAIEGLGHVVISGVMGDQQAAALGLGVINEGDSKITYGTGSFILVNTSINLVYREGFLTTVLWQFPDQPVIFGLEASIESGGSSIAYLKDNLKLFKDYKEIDIESEDHSSYTKDIYMLNLFNGIFSPYWNSEAKSLIYGLTFENKNLDLYRACLEGVCYRAAECIELLKEANGSIKADGGMTNNTYMTSFQSSLIENNFEVSNFMEGTTLGIYFSALVWSNKIRSTADAKSMFPQTTRIEKVNENTKLEIRRKFQKYKELLKFVLSSNG
jgi:glycerol kinase